MGTGLSTVFPPDASLCLLDRQINAVDISPRSRCTGENMLELKKAKWWDVEGTVGWVYWQRTLETTLIVVRCLIVYHTCTHTKGGHNRHVSHLVSVELNDITLKQLEKRALTSLCCEPIRLDEDCGTLSQGSTHTHTHSHSLSLRASFLPLVTNICITQRAKPNAPTA